MNKPKRIDSVDALMIIQASCYPYNMIYQIMFETGFRISDVIQLKLKHVDLMKNMIIITEQKSGKHRAVEISAGLAKKFIERSKFQGKEDYIFKSRNFYENHINRATVHRHLKNICAGIGIDCSAHSFRALYAQRIYNRTNSLKIVQEALNHSKSEITMAYVDENQKKELRERYF